MESIHNPQSGKQNGAVRSRCCFLGCKEKNGQTSWLRSGLTGVSRLAGEHLRYGFLGKFLVTGLQILGNFPCGNWEQGITLGPCLVHLHI